MSGTENIYDLEWKFYECLLQSGLELISFVIIVVALLWPAASRSVSLKEALQASCAGFYGNVFVVLSIIWHLHVVWSYRALTEVFIFISHVQTQRAIYNRTKTRSILAVAVATLISRSIGLFVNLYCFT